MVQKCGILAQICVILFVVVASKKKSKKKNIPQKQATQTNPIEDFETNSNTKKNVFISIVCTNDK